MKYFLPLFFICLLMIWSCKGAAQNENVITIKAGETISSVNKHFFLYPEFTSGKVYFNSGDSAKSKLNYHYVLGAIQFISPEGDTLSIANESEVSSVVIQQDSFFVKDRQYVQLLKTYPFGKLVISQIIKLHDEHFIGAYGISSPTHNIETKQTLIAEQTLKLTLKKDLVLAKNKNFYLLNNNNKYISVSKKSILTAFSKNKEVIDTYIKTNNINFQNEQDLLNLFTYLSAL